MLITLFILLPNIALAKSDAIIPLIKLYSELDKITSLYSNMEHAKDRIKQIDAGIELPSEFNSIRGGASIAKKLNEIEDGIHSLVIPDQNNLPEILTDDLVDLEQRRRSIKIMVTWASSLKRNTILSLNAKKKLNDILSKSKSTYKALRAAEETFFDLHSLLYPHPMASVFGLAAIEIDEVFIEALGNINLAIGKKEKEYSAFLKFSKKQENSNIVSNLHRMVLKIEKEEILKEIDELYKKNSEAKLIETNKKLLKTKKIARIFKAKYQRNSLYNMCPNRKKYSECTHDSEKIIWENTLNKTRNDYRKTMVEIKNFKNKTKSLNRKAKSESSKINQLNIHLLENQSDSIAVSEVFHYFNIK